ncbi:hypothetical protein [Nocardia salmonicida]|uniref:hypothetical protein n=1 Tax=Nocardia salmonicida TaxID=53431 RepID=UPI0007A47B0B|nr:hypothetical protein [Nocardia salmonicida]MBC7299800.1 hypothetical protein [Nocardia sp.]
MPNPGRIAVIAVASTAVVAAIAAGALVSCSSSDDEDTSNGTVTSADSRNHADPRAATGLVIGLDDDVATHVVAGTANKFQARCEDAADDERVEITTEDGWKVQLTHGSQTLTAENEKLGFPAATFTTAESAIANSRARNPDGFPLGITWDRPNTGEVEVKLKEEIPSSWSAARRNTELLVFLHVACP